jgi:hypothetical protein
MSLDTWKAEFYPITAKECPVEQAIEHSLRKWLGLRPEALQQHGVRITCGNLANETGDGRIFLISSSSCALCALHYAEDDDQPCASCPLAISRGGASCDGLAKGEKVAPWWVWGDEKDHEPMIAALEKAAASIPHPTTDTP